jgi:hypothetical protein
VKKRIGRDEYCTLHLRDGDVDVDFCDLHLLELGVVEWGITAKNGKKYATAHITRDSISRNISMHRLIMMFPDGLVDHKDRYTLNNRRGNLREATHRQNSVNSPPRKNGKVKYKGVSVYGKKGRFRATIQIEGRWKQIGTYNTAETAARAYDEAAFEAFGDAAYLNRSEFDL